MTNHVEQGAAASGDETSICQFCGTIDFDAAFNLRVKRTIGVVIPKITGNIDKLELETCSMCRLFQSVLVQERNPGPRSFHLRAFSSFTINGLPINVKAKQPVALAIIPGIANKDFHTWEGHADQKRGVLMEALQATSEPPDAIRAYLVNSNHIQYDRVNTWFNTCEQSHSKTCESRKSSGILSITCIDCVTHKLVDTDTTAKYFALSYVWGKPRDSSIQHILDDKISSDLPLEYPRLIEDAISVVKKLGGHLLWVDRYCIRSNNHSRKRVMIQNMDIIYESAWATLVASHSLSGDSGLPGVSVSRLPQPSVSIQDRIIVSTLPELHEALENTAYMTRGWTYQELILSRRCLFFTDYQVYFLCAATSFCESISSPLGNVRYASDSHTYLGPKTFNPGGEMVSKKDKTTEIVQLTNHMVNYTNRHLTYNSDALNAFQGLLSRSDFPAYHGIPIAPGNEIKDIEFTTIMMHVGFIRCLFWEPLGTRSLRRRPEFPSWSWTGWEGPIHYRGEKGSTVQGVAPLRPQENARAAISVVKKNGERTSILEALNHMNQSPQHLDFLSKEIEVTGAAVQLRFQAAEKGANSKLWEPVVCTCHPQSEHKEPIDSWSDLIWGFASFCDYSEDETLVRQLCQRSWTCLLLFQSSNKLPKPGQAPAKFAFLIVDEAGKPASRIGTVTLRQWKKGSIDDLEPKVFTIVLG